MNKVYYSFSSDFVYFLRRRTLFGHGIGLEATVEPYSEATSTFHTINSPAENSRTNVSERNLFRLFGARHSVSLSKLKVPSNTHEFIIRYS